MGTGAFLNDVTVDRDGTVYVSDSRADKIYRLKGDTWEVLAEGEQLKQTKCLLAVGTDKPWWAAAKLVRYERWT